MANYYSPAAGMTLGANKLREEERFTSGAFKQTSAVIHFRGNICRSEAEAARLCVDEGELCKFIENSDSFKIGRIMKITDQQASAVAQKKVAVQSLARSDDGAVPEEVVTETGKVPFRQGQINKDHVAK